MPSLANVPAASKVTDVKMTLMSVPLPIIRAKMVLPVMLPLEPSTVRVRPGLRVALGQQI